MCLLFFGTVPFVAIWFLFYGNSFFEIVWNFSFILFFKKGEELFVFVRYSDLSSIFLKKLVLLSFVIDRFIKKKDFVTYRII